MKQISTYGVLDSISTCKDKTLKLVFRTQELLPDEAGVLHGLVHQEGWVAFAPDAIQEIDIKEATPEFKSGKSVSQRLRNVLWVYWEQKGKIGDFETFRNQQTEKFIDVIKSKLE